MENWSYEDEMAAQRAELEAAREHRMAIEREIARVKRELADENSERAPQQVGAVEGLEGAAPRCQLIIYEVPASLTAEVVRRDGVLELEVSIAELVADREHRIAIEREIALVKRELADEGSERATQQVGAIEGLQEATPRCQLSTHEGPASLTAEVVGRDGVAHVTVAPRLQDLPPEANTERAVNSDFSGQAREVGDEAVVPEQRWVAIPETELTGHIPDSREQGPTDKVVAFEAVGRAEPDHSSQSAVCGQCAPQADGSPGEADVTSR